MKSILVFCLFYSLSLCQSDENYLPIDEISDTNLYPTNTAACQVDINSDTGSPQPLYIRPGTQEFFHPSDRRGLIELNVNQQIELFCVQFNSPINVSGLITAECFEGTTFRFNGILYDFRDFSCSNWPVSIAVRTTQRCYNNAIIVNVGFQVNERFLRVYTSCHNTVLETNHYTHYQLTPRSDSNQRSVTRPSWRQLDFFPGKNVDNLHTRVTQRETIARILESPSCADLLIEQPNSEIFLARGHMAAMTDFILANEQRSTFLFINTSPQWQTFNARNWYAIELSTRRLAADRNITLDTYTGTFGVTHLSCENGARRQIFLDYPALQIPVPMLYYKIIVNQANHSGIVFIGVNNVHLTLADIQRDYIVCNDVSDRITYVNWVKNDIVRGYSYACEVNDFLRSVPHVQGLTVTSLLI
ncbi:hypothetical protein PVAND_006070 [Polypedilum vanderplanki]|uniref:DNA/RNA non-specific endonuclease domain-containing protein n=1 Tax=Polypedilum vanderplanki TaxID=319348 RepID=A0A9J6C2V8_POLVA|nr:hypothetical protein PVAND_006070 [Polypedilum vanderplanki]